MKTGKTMVKKRSDPLFDAPLTKLHGGLQHYVHRSNCAQESAASPAMDVDDTSVAPLPVLEKEESHLLW